MRPLEVRNGRKRRCGTFLKLHIAAVTSVLAVVTICLALVLSFCSAAGTGYASDKPGGDVDVSDMSAGEAVVEQGSENANEPAPTEEGPTVEVTATPTPTPRQVEHNVSYLQDDELYKRFQDERKELQDEAFKFAGKFKDKAWEKLNGLSAFPAGFVAVYVNVRRAYLPFVIICLAFTIIDYLVHQNNKKRQRRAIIIGGIILPIVATFLVFGVPVAVAFMY